MDKPYTTVGSVCALMLCLALPLAARPGSAVQASAEPALSQLNTDMVSQFHTFAYDSSRTLGEAGWKTASQQDIPEKSSSHAVSNICVICINTDGKTARNQTAHGTRHTVHRTPRHAIGDFVLTAYTLDYHCTGKRSSEPGFGITASGTHARIGRTIAVDPRVIPIGSRVFIEGIGTRIAEDTGGGVKGRHLDILFPNERAALSFGVKRHVRVYLEEIPR